MLKKLVKKVLPKSVKEKLVDVKNNYFDGYSCKSYSQEGEDMILRRMFESQQTGFYVDVGAHHPKRFSNTYYFYKRGWRGINIDASPGSMKIFNRLRRRDINLEVVVSDRQEKNIFYFFNEAALNSFSKDISDARVQNGKFKIISKKELKTERLKEILDKYLPKNKEIDFLSIDVEGLDFKVLQSNDWQIYRPKYVLVEILNFSFESLLEGSIYKFMLNKGYSLYAKSVLTVIFKRS